MTVETKSIPPKIFTPWCYSKRNRSGERLLMRKKKKRVTAREDSPDSVVRKRLGEVGLGNYWFAAVASWSPFSYQPFTIC